MYQASLTLSTKEEKLRQFPPRPLVADEETENQVVNLYPEQKRQRILGFGGAFTEASAVNYMALSPGRRQELIEAYFGEEGAHYGLCRMHIGSCDFSTREYAYTPPRERDMGRFSLGHEEGCVLPFVRDALRRAPGLWLFASPWSPPYWMKTTGRAQRGGKLSPEWADSWCDYVAAYLLAYRQRGVPIQGLTVQNEPKATQTWESCVYSAQEESELIQEHLAPALDRAGLSDIRLMVWDHNRERVYERARDSFRNDFARRRVWGVAYHWYSGAHFQALDLTHEAFPDKALLQTEFCCGLGKDPLTGFDSALRYAGDLIDNLNHWSNGCVDWNMVLNLEGGPYHDRDSGCLAPVLVDAANDRFHLTGAYYGMVHVSRYLLPGSTRIGVSCYRDALKAAAALNPDGSLGCALANTAETPLDVNLRLEGLRYACTLPPRSLASLRITKG